MWFGTIKDEIHMRFIIKFLIIDAVIALVLFNLIDFGAHHWAQSIISNQTALDQAARGILPSFNGI